MGTTPVAAESIYVIIKGMNNIRFEEDSQYNRSVSASEKRSWLSGLVIKTGLAKDNVGAQKVLLIVLIITIAAIVAVWTV